MFKSLCVFAVLNTFQPIHSSGLVRCNPGEKENLQIPVDVMPFPIKQWLKNRSAKRKYTKKQFGQPNKNHLQFWLTLNHFSELYIQVGAENQYFNHQTSEY